MLALCIDHLNLANIKVVPSSSGRISSGVVCYNFKMALTNQTIEFFFSKRSLNPISSFLNAQASLCYGLPDLMKRPSLKLIEFICVSSNMLPFKYSNI